MVKYSVVLYFCSIRYGRYGGVSSLKDRRYCAVSAIVPLTSLLVFHAYYGPLFTNVRGFIFNNNDVTNLPRQIAITSTSNNRFHGGRQQ